MRGSIVYAGQSIAYQARHSARKTLAISVHPNGAVEVVAPIATNREAIEHRLHRRAGWILQQCRYFEQFLPRTPERRYVGGETHLYLGRQYRLKIVNGDEDRVRLKGAYFWITVAGVPSPERVRALLADWYRERADSKLEDRFQALVDRFSRNLARTPTLAIRPMKRRWGSYSGRGQITLNRDLVRGPLPCIDYVIVHELAHARYPNHGRAFFDLLSQMMPDWEKRKLALERMLA
ncbi:MULTISPECIES: SprT family zinc-dependent metalloprotease [Rhodopseudomonas]|nr:MULTISPECIES: SprT family zinc-dependent metalloprotease [Rhodopseudomonas]MDF3810768.1 SprT family zinc-dependent metalloprotease [Rhodopseudomonas sp. BAL398]WOK20569.1 SprT family zinc-dependent metalloprotease [Rhodopseudomonas sp. BAL398]